MLISTKEAITGVEEMQAKVLSCSDLKSNRSLKRLYLL